MANAYISLADRLQDGHMPEPNSGCWLWIKTVDRKGYGRLSGGRGILTMAHRASYELEHRIKIPPGMTIDHKCRVRCCINPDHMEMVTNRINVLRGIGPSAINAKKTECKRGHPLAGSNLYVNPTTGGRTCRECQKRF